MRGSGVLGIKFERTASEVKFARFFSIVQNAASQGGKVFFLDAGEGREIITDELEGEDLSGWLVDESLVDSFKSGWLSGDVDPVFDDSYCFADWKQEEDGSISIFFE